MKKLNADILLASIEDFTKSIELKPTALAYYNRGYSKGKLEDYQGAIEDYSKAIEIESQVDAYYLRGIAKRNLEEEGFKYSTTENIYKRI
tara:strand:- start:372 stop:641 length:270 start_codon:yes stop_codon:yes gene_type:complete